MRLLALLVLVAPGLCAGDALHTSIAAELQRQALQGATWSTLTPDDGLHVDAAGTRDARTGALLRPDDRVQVGSIAKTVLAVGVLRLVSQKRLSLDTPLAQVLPSIALDNPWHATDPLRIRHLLDHTAGLDDARFSQVFSLRARPDAALADAFADVQPLRVRSRPGTRHSYSNSGYTLLGMVVEAVTGQRYDHWLGLHVLQPLGMRDSTVGFVTQSTDPRLAMGHFERGAPHATVPAPLRPATQLTTTAADMARLARFLLGDGRVDGVRLVDARLLAAMGEPFGTEAARAGLRVGYGLGLAMRDRHGALAKCHGGSTVGYRAMLCVFPAADRAFFVAVNADVEGADYNAIDRLLVDALHLPATRAHASIARPGDAGAWEGWYVPAPNRFATFAWVDATFGFVRVRRTGDGLSLAPFGAPAFALAPVAPGLYRAPDRLVASHAFLLARDGTRVMSTGLQSWERVSWWPIAARAATLIAGMAGLAWLLIAGTLRRPWRRTMRKRPLFPAWLGAMALVLPVPLLAWQPFLALGDPTAGSVLLMLGTGLLPLAMLTGLVRTARAPASWQYRVDALAMFAVLQFTVVLALAGLLPLRLWA